jgi:hypothetical protein
MPPRTPTYQLQVTLQGSRRPIWRRLLVPANISLDTLHRTLQWAMGWQDSHLHQFIFQGTRYGVPDPDDHVEVVDERRTRLNRLLKEPKDELVYEYDFGDDWAHSLMLEEVIRSEIQLLSPVCTAGARACPPEDCGGIRGYEHLLAVLADPSHPEHRERRRWIGGSFDPEAFNLATFNGYLQRIR